MPRFAVRVSETWTQANRFAEILDRAIVIAFVIVGVAAVVVGGGQILTRLAYVQAGHQVNDRGLDNRGACGDSSVRVN